MGNGTLAEKINSRVRLNWLLPLTLLENSENIEVLQEVCTGVVPSLEEAKRTAEYIGCTLGDLYLAPNSLYSFVYFKGLLYFDLVSFDLEALELFGLRDIVKQRSKEVEKYLSKRDFKSLFGYIIEKKLLFTLFTQLFDEIPDDQKFSIFADIYTRSEYGFSALALDDIEHIFSYRTEEQKSEVIESLRLLSDSDGMVTIYRGEGSKSTHYTEALSWSLNLSTALFFANRFGRGKLYRTRVSIQDIAAHLVSRNEAEVLVHPNNLVNKVEELKLETVKQTKNRLEQNAVLSQFNILKNRIKSEWFLSPSGVHGVNHTQRVLFHVLNFVDFLGLPDSSAKVLIDASLLHDIGRVNDTVDETHGYKSWHKAKELGLVKAGSEEDEKILQYLIETHCLSDKLAYYKVREYYLKDEDRAIELLKIFKDADALDRVRLRDLDVRYLRTDAAPLFVSLANTIYSESLSFL